MVDLLTDVNVSLATGKVVAVFQRDYGDGNNIEIRKVVDESKLPALWDYPDLVFLSDLPKEQVKVAKYEAVSETPSESKQDT